MYIRIRTFSRLLVGACLCSIFLFEQPLVAQNRCDCVFVNWMASPEVRKELKLTTTQTESIAKLFQELRTTLEAFTTENKLPIDEFDGPRKAMIKELFPQFKLARAKAFADFELKLKDVLDPSQQDDLLKRLIDASGPRSLVESAMLRERLHLADGQVEKLEMIYFGADDLWHEKMHDGDKFQHVDTPEEMERTFLEYRELRDKIVRERIWKIRAEIDEAQRFLDEKAILVLTVEQKLLFDKLSGK